MIPSDALRFALLCKAAYGEAPTVGAESGAARVIFSEDGELSVAAIPGTDNWACVEADIDFEEHQTDFMGPVHRGFFDSFVQIWPECFAHSVDVITGHSEGASIALIYAAFLCLVGKPPRAVFGFEPAKISTDGKIAWILAKNKVSVYLFKTGNDLVPDLPLSVIENWQHPAPLILIGTPALPFANIEDHMIDSVVAALANN